MMRSAVLLAVLAAAAAAAAAETAAPPGHWRALDAPPHPQRRVASTWAVEVPGDAAERLAAVVAAVSDPDSPRYGRHVTGRGELARHVYGGRALEAAERVAAMMPPGSGAAVHPDGDSVRATLAVADAERLLGARLCDFEHVASGRRILRVCGGAAAARLPRGVAAVSPFLYFPITPALVAAERRAAGAAPPKPAPRGGGWPNGCTGGVQGLQCGGWIEPSVLRARYGWNATAAQANSTIGIAAFDGEFTDAADLKAFSTDCVVSPPVTVARFRGDEGQPNKPSACTVGECSESLMDVQYAGAMSPASTLDVFYDSNYDLLALVTNVSSLAAPPLVLSISYGLDESDQPSVAYVRRVDAEFQKLAARGVGVVVASGDGGVYGRGCTGGAKLCPTFPATAPHVTSVGATQFAGSAIGDEVCSPWSGGGTSNVFGRPKWQSKQVSAYLAASHGADEPPASSFNSTGRAFPDVSALGGGGDAPFCVYLSGSFQAGEGTSASAPVVAGMFAQLNAARLAAGRPPLGFVNPAIYAAGVASSGFHDVTSGTNSNGGQYGFPAAAGWDPCSGLGTLRMGGLAAALLDL